MFLAILVDYNHVISIKPVLSIHLCVRPFSHLDTRADQEVHQHRLDLGLAGFEVISSNEHPLLHGQLDGARHESVLRRAVDVGAALQDTGHCKQSGGGDLCSILMER